MKTVLPLVSIAAVLTMVGCGVEGVPLAEELIGDDAAAQLSAVKQPGGNNGNGNEGQGHHYGWTHGEGRHGRHHKSHPGNEHWNGRCAVQMNDPLAKQMPPIHLDEDFEHLPLGNAPSVYHWIDPVGSSVTVSTDTAYAGKRSLKIVSKGDVSTAYDVSGVKFCVRCEATQRFTASFAVRFESFVNWNGVAVTDNPNMAYWWWLRSAGTMFDVGTFATLKPKTWYKVELDIDRKADLATIKVAGAVHTARLSTTWYADSALQPMGCVRLSNISQVAQTMYVDNVQVTAVK